MQTGVILEQSHQLKCQSEAKNKTLKKVASQQEATGPVCVIEGLRTTLHSSNPETKVNQFYVEKITQKVTFLCAPDVSYDFSHANCFTRKVMQELRV